MRSALALVAAALALAPGGSAAAPSGIAGVVTRGPTTPVCRVGVPCSEPAAGIVIAVWRDGGLVARAATAADGTFRLRLRPGAYVVGVARKLPVGGSQPKAVLVRPGRFTAVRLAIDTGIR